MPSRCRRSAPEAVVDAGVAAPAANRRADPSDRCRCRRSPRRSLDASTLPVSVRTAFVERKARLAKAPICSVRNARELRDRRRQRRIVRRAARENLLEEQVVQRAYRLRSAAARRAPPRWRAPSSPTRRRLPERNTPPSSPRRRAAPPTPERRRRCRRCRDRLRC